MDSTLIVLLMFVAFLLVLMLGMPLTWSLGGLSVIFGVLFWGDIQILNIFIRSVIRTTTSISYVCIPLFIFMGAVLEKSGSADRLFDSLYVVMGRLKGGLALSTIIISALMGAATGIIGASITIMAMLALPAMMKYRYNQKMACGVVMSAGSLGTLIPPSVILVIYGSLANISIAKLFAGGIGAGLLLAALYGIYVLITSHLNPEYGPPISKEESEKYSTMQKITMIVASILPTLALIVVVLGSILLGAATPNEAAALGSVGAILISIIYKTFSWDIIKNACYSTLKTTSMIMMIILSASMFTSVFLGLGGGKVVEQMVLLIGTDKWVVFTTVVVIIIIMGMILDSYGVLLIGVPLFTPIIYSFGFDPIWFGIVFALLIQVSVLSPPFAYAVFYLKGIVPDIPLSTMYRAVLPFLALQILAIIIVCIFPNIILYFPNLM